MLTNFGAWCWVTTWHPIKILGPEAKPVENHWYRSVLVSRSTPSVSPTAPLPWFIQCLFLSSSFHPKYVAVLSPALHALSVSFFTVLSLVQPNWYQSLPSSLLLSSSSSCSLSLWQTALTVIWSWPWCGISRRAWSSSRLRPSSLGRSCSRSTEASKT